MRTITKMFDFCLYMMGPSLDHCHVSATVKGSFGYYNHNFSDYGTTTNVKKIQ